jgi:hypothetical protein
LDEGVTGKEGMITALAREPAKCYQSSRELWYFCVRIEKVLWKNELLEGEWI